jgi:zinc protease
VPGKTGVAHFLEHMMFKGTATVAPTEFSRTVSKNGGRDNAYTSFDSTGYYQTVAPTGSRLVMRMEADHGQPADQRKAIPERQVVLEERDTCPPRCSRRRAGTAVRPAQASACRSAAMSTT